MIRVGKWLNDEHSRQCRERRAWLKEHGFCIVCGQTYNEPGYVLCRNCMRKRRQHDMKYDPTGEKRRQSHKKLYYDRIAAGLCVECGKPLDREGRKCQVCRDKAVEVQRVYKMRKRMEREAQAARERSRA